MEVSNVTVWGGIPQTNIVEGDLLITVHDCADCRWTGRGKVGIQAQPYLSDGQGIFRPIAERGNPTRNARIVFPHGTAPEEILRNVKEAI